MKELGTAIGYAIVVIVAYFGKDILDRIKIRKKEKAMPDLLNETSRIRQQVQDYLVKLQAYTGCARACLYEYSNGSYTHSQISLQYIECTYEATDESTRPIINIFKKMPIAPYLKMITIIQESKVGWVKISDDNPDVEISKMQKYWRNRVSYNFKITNTVWDGVISLSWINQDANMDAHELENIQIMIMRIHQLMSQLVKK